MSTFKIAGKDFYQYVAYRLKKDGLGFLPSSRWEEGSTDGKTFIKAMVPQHAYHFLVFAHELGHCKSSQLPRSMGSSYLGLGVCDSTLQNEFNAWVWAIRYIRKLKMEITPAAWTRALSDSFKTYTRQADNKRLANDFIEKLNDMLGINLEMESVRQVRGAEDTLKDLRKYMTSWDVLKSRPIVSDKPPVLVIDDSWWTPVGWFDETTTTGKFKSNLEEDKSIHTKKHRPWMDLMDKKRKHFWKSKK